VRLPTVIASSRPEGIAGGIRVDVFRSHVSAWENVRLARWVQLCKHIPCDERSIAMLVSSSPTPIFYTLFGPDVELGYRPIHLPKLHIVTVDEPSGGFDGGLIINTIQLNHADRQGFEISLPVGNWIVLYSFIVDTRSRLHMNVRFAPQADVRRPSQASQKRTSGAALNH
jgi:hypothetical protein